MVTGAESGIGKACALALGAVGAAVAFTCFRDEAAAARSHSGPTCATRTRSRRCSPPPPRHRAGVDIAFAASCLDDGETIVLWYSLEDRLPRRVRIRRFATN